MHDKNEMIEFFSKWRSENLWCNFKHRHSSLSESNHARKEIYDRYMAFLDGAFNGQDIDGKYQFITQLKSLGHNKFVEHYIDKLEPEQQTAIRIIL
jgi:hypothetical protein